MDPTEETFREQYRELNNETLREIAGGEVPWTRDGRYLHGARRAARALLLERGADNVPFVPLVPFDAPRYPRAVRLGLMAATATLAVSMMVGWSVIFPLEVAADEDACAEAKTLLIGSDLGWDYGLELSACEVEREAAHSENGAEVTPIALEGCITLNTRLLNALGEQPRRRTEVQRFAKAPRPGRHCTTAPVRMAELVVHEGRPWWVRLIAPVP